MTDKILVAFDNAEASTAAAVFAAQRAAKTDETVSIVHVGDDLTVDEIANYVGDEFDARDVTVEFNVVSNSGSEDQNTSITRVLRDFITDGNYSIVVVGNQDYGLFEQFASRSVSDSLLDMGDVPVTLVPPNCFSPMGLVRV